MKTVAATRRLLLVAAATMLVGAGPAAAQTVGAFAFGRGGAAARLAVDMQHRLRELVASTGSWQTVNLLAVLQPEGMPRKQQALADARRLTAKGKKLYEQLELEQAVKSFTVALKKFEYGYAWLDQPAELIECLIYLGATSVLVGEPERARMFFLRALDLPGRKVLDSNLFPPNIQEAFEQSRTAYQAQTTAQVALVSVPLGAEIYLDGKYVGGTPLQLSGLRPGVHLVRANKDGYRPWGGRITVVQGRKRTLRISLRKAGRQARFSVLMRALVGKLVRGQPAAAAAPLAEFIGAQRLLLVWAEGSRAALALKGWAIAGDGQHAASRQGMVDATSPAYRQQLDDFLRRLLQLDPAAPGEVQAIAQGGQGQGGELELGLDLSPGGEQSDEAESGRQEGEGAVTATEQQSQATTGAGPAMVRPVEEQQSAGAEGIVEQTPVKKPEREKSVAAWWPDDWYRKWWFWTAVGVLAAGAATGTYFLVSGGSSGGGLVLEMH